jgi:predicted Zn-dependent protease
MQEYFYQMSDYACSLLRDKEVCLCNFKGEDSDFIRLNHAKVRQAGSVTQRYFNLGLINEQRYLSYNLSLSGEKTTDQEQIKRAIESVRATLTHLLPDPYLTYAEEVRSSHYIGENHLPDSADVLERILTHAKNQDLVGIYAAGGIYTGFANSLGQRNWHSSYNFNFDWSLYHQADKAVKTSYAGFVWDDKVFTDIITKANQQLDLIRQPPRTISPGKYRVYLAPAALEEIMLMLLEGFSLKAQRSKQSPLLQMNENAACLHTSINLSENTGLSADFQGAGFHKPAQVTLLQHGHLVGALVSPRSAKEYAVPDNGAHHDESPQFLDMSAGTLASTDILAQLDTGVYINNLWYLNYSDFAACRLTGMTRFATFWVENGTIIAPLNVMRFDDTIYNILGTNLLHLTQARELLLDKSTYEKRSTAGMLLPGALVAEFPFTL